MICVEGGREKGGIVIVTLGTTAYESIVFIFAAARSPSGHSSGAGQTSNFSFQNIRLTRFESRKYKYEKNELRYNTWHAGLQISQFQEHDIQGKITSEQGWTNCEEL